MLSLKFSSNFIKSVMKLLSLINLIPDNKQNEEDGVGFEHIVKPIQTRSMESGSSCLPLDPKKTYLKT